MKIRDAVDDASSLLTTVEEIRSGKITPIAPDPAMYLDWSEEEKHRFVTLMRRVYRETSGK